MFIQRALSLTTKRHVPRDGTRMQRKDRRNSRISLASKCRARSPSPEVLARPFKKPRTVTAAPAASDTVSEPELHPDSPEPDPNEHDESERESSSEPAPGPAPNEDDVDEWELEAEVVNCMPRTVPNIRSWADLRTQIKAELKKKSKTLPLSKINQLMVLRNFATLRLKGYGKISASIEMARRRRRSFSSQGPCELAN